MGDRLKKFFGKELKQAWKGGKDMARERPVMAVVLGGITVLGTTINPLMPAGLAGFLASNKTLLDDHKRQVAEIKEAHAKGESLERFKTDLSSFKPERIKEYYNRGDEENKVERKGRSMVTVAGTVLEVATIGGVSLVINGLDGYMAARHRNKLIKRLESEPPKGNTPPTP